MGESDDDPWFRQPWDDQGATEEAEDLDTAFPASPARMSDADACTLLAPLAGASAALARLDARLEGADPSVAEGLRARLALREAAGWLAHQHGAWVHPTDLGLRAASMTSSLTVAAMSGRLRAVLPTTMGDGPSPAALAEDLAISQALQVGQLWRRLAEHRGWTPLGDAASLHLLLAQLGCTEPSEDAVADWLRQFAGRADVSGAAPPALLLAAQAAQAWPGHEPGHEPGQGRGDRLGTAALFLAACTWRRACGTATLALPVWSATPGHLDALGLAAGPAWLAGFLDAVTDAAHRAGQELSRLQAAAGRAGGLHRTARSQLPAAAALALRTPVLTARGLADRLRVSPQAALALLKQLVAAGVLREATGRASWRAFVVA